MIKILSKDEDCILFSDGEAVFRLSADGYLEVLIDCRTGGYLPPEQFDPALDYECWESRGPGWAPEELGL